MKKYAGLLFGHELDFVLLLCLNSLHADHHYDGDVDDCKFCNRSKAPLYACVGVCELKKKLLAHMGITRVRIVMKIFGIRKKKKKIFIHSFIVPLNFFLFFIFIIVVVKSRVDLIKKVNANLRALIPILNTYIQLPFFASHKKVNSICKKRQL
jgi:hypothetical protein